MGCHWLLHQQLSVGVLSHQPIGGLHGVKVPLQSAVGEFVHGGLVGALFVDVSRLLPVVACQGVVVQRQKLRVPALDLLRGHSLGVARSHAHGHGGGGGGGGLAAVASGWALKGFVGRNGRQHLGNGHASGRAVGGRGFCIGIERLEQAVWSRGNPRNVGLSCIPSLRLAKLMGVGQRRIRQRHHAPNRGLAERPARRVVAVCAVRCRRLPRRMHGLDVNGGGGGSQHLRHGGSCIPSGLGVAALQLLKRLLADLHLRFLGGLPLLPLLRAVLLATAHHLIQREFGDGKRLRNGQPTLFLLLPVPN
mmetsp:Transcript_3084/g.6063  ORF Transcript_3084/g.6063 Transcript_3084/m.6063 type:complete len:306 (-) Transcript_3084:250-1167(-)